MVSPLQQKLRITGPVVITGNRLSDGAVVHRLGTGHWTERLGEAQILRSAEDVHKALKAAQSEHLEAVGPYVAPVVANDASAQPGNLREFIRTSGPTFDLPSDSVVASNADSGEAEKAAA